MPRTKILIVDDEILIARELEARLTSMGYQVSGIAASGTDAIRLAGESHPDVVLMDIVLKGDMDGVEAAGEIRRNCQIPVIYVTAYTDDRTLERAKITEPFGYVVKPFSERELKANIEMALYKHQAEARLRKVEQWFADALEEPADAVIAADREGRITVFSPAAEAVTAWAKEEVIGRKLGDVLRLVHRGNGQPISLEDAADGPVVCLAKDTLLVDKSDETIPIDSMTSCLRDDEDRPMGTVSVFRDVMGQRHGALVALNCEVALIVAEAVSLQGMLQLCAESVARGTNAALVRIWTLDELRNVLELQAGAGAYTVLHGPRSKIPLGHFEIGRIAMERKAIRTNDLFRGPHVSDPEWIRREGIIALAGYPLLVGGRLLGVLAVFSRRTFASNTFDALESAARTMALGIERKLLEEQLRESQKMEAIGQLAGGVAHDFNNLLTIISGCSDLLMRQNGLDETARRHVVEIVKAAERAASLTQKLLAFSRKQLLRPLVLNLNSLVYEMVNVLMRLVGDRIVLSLSLDPSLSNIVADPGNLEQVIMNLTINARDAMPDGGKLTLETRNLRADEAPVQARQQSTVENFVMLAVSDTGCGMTPEVLAHVFEPFFTTKERGKGSGLGLSTTYGIVTQSGGHVEVQSQPNVGTSVRVFLPSTEKPLPSRPPDQVETLTEGRETILVVEDEDTLRSLISSVLSVCGYTVLEASNGNQALQMVEGHPEPIDLVLTDVVMPEMDGRRLAEQLTHVRPDAKVLYMTGYTEEAVIRDQVREASADFVQKPFTPGVLTKKIREFLDKSLTPHPARKR